MSGTHATILRRPASLWVVFGLLVGLVLAFAVSGVQSARADGNSTGTESIVVTPTEVDFQVGKSRSKEEVWIRGSGFAPGTQIALLVGGSGYSGGALYDISTCRLNNDGETCRKKSRKDGGGVPWPLVVNDHGGFASNWRLGRFTRKNVGSEGMFTVWAVNADTFEDLASAPIALCNLTHRDEGAEVPKHCSS